MGSSSSSSPARAERDAGRTGSTPSRPVDEAEPVFHRETPAGIEYGCQALLDLDITTESPPITPLGWLDEQGIRARNVRPWSSGPFACRREHRHP